jgi:hypothetical protein
MDPSILAEWYSISQKLWKSLKVTEISNEMNGRGFHGK